jgi:hypothetical protein
VGTANRLIAGLNSFSLGSSGIRIFTESEFPEGQRGYSVGVEGESLVGEEEGDWHTAWKVIGFEESCGDPIFVDEKTDGLPVFTAVHGAGSWAPTRIVDTLDSFRQTLAIVSRVAVGRENPVKLEANPINDSLRREVLERIKTLNPGADLEFWELTMGFY